MVCLDYTYLFYMQPLYEQLPLGCQIAKQLSGLNLFLLRNNKDYRLKKRGVFHLIICNKQRTAVKPAILHNSAVSKALLGRFYNH